MEMRQSGLYDSFFFRIPWLHQSVCDTWRMKCEMLANKKNSWGRNEIKPNKIDNSTILQEGDVMRLCDLRLQCGMNR